jgi:hypothetical protein
LNFFSIIIYYICKTSNFLKNTKQKFFLEKLLKLIYAYYFYRYANEFITTSMISSFGQTFYIEIIFLLFSINFAVGLYSMFILTIKLILIILSFMKLISLYIIFTDKKTVKNNISDENENKSLLENGNLIIKCVICHENIDISFSNQFNYVKLKCHSS